MNSNYHLVSFPSSPKTLLMLIRQVCWQQILSTFLYENIFISHSFAKNSFVGYRILGLQVFIFQHFECHHTAFWPLLFLMSLLLILLWFLCMQWVILFLLLLRLSLYVWLLIIWHHAFSQRFLCVYLTCSLLTFLDVQIIFLIMFGAINYLNIFFLLFISLNSFWGSH